MTRIQEKLAENKKILSIYFTAGYPELRDTVPILESLEKAGADMIEIGLPFSDPLADGPTIQSSSTKALKNGMTTKLLFEQLKSARNTVSIPLIIMGYFNPVLQYGVEAFCKKCNEVGIDGLILPDLPLHEYTEHYKAIFEKHSLSIAFLITPQTSEERIREIDKASNSFIYVVSSFGTTGAKTSISYSQKKYFDKIGALALKNPQVVGFGVSNAATFNAATVHAKGAIIGSAFINILTEKGLDGIPDFIKTIRSEV